MAMPEKYEKVLKKQKQKINQDDLSKIKLDAQGAHLILNSPQFTFLLEYLNKAKDSIVETIVNNRIRKVTETMPMSETMTRAFETTREEQLNELSGQFKFIETLLQDLETIAKLPDELDRAEKEGTLDIVSSKEE